MADGKLPPEEMPDTINPPTEELRGSLFQLPLEPGWFDRSVYCVGGPIVDGFQSSIAVTTEHRPKLTKLVDHFDEQLGVLEGQLDDFELVEKGERTLAGRPACFAHYSWTSPEGVTLRQSQWYLHQPPCVLVVTATAHADSFDSLSSVFDGALRGFRMLSVRGSQRIR